MGTSCSDIWVSDFREGRVRGFKKKEFSDMIMLFNWGAPPKVGGVACC